LVSIEEFGRMLEEIAEEIPEEFYEGLNLGISLIEEAKLSAFARRDDLYILGEYFHNQMGRGIAIYYGSFAKLHSSLKKAELIGELRATLRHEFRHHMEGRAGERGLEKQDERELRDYLDS
jgi:hypothetical protein